MREYAPATERRGYTGEVFQWLKSLRKQTAPTHTIGSRDGADQTLRVDVSEFAPGVLPFLGMTAYLRLELYEAAARAVSGAPSLRAKDVMSRVAGIALAKQQKITAEIRRRGEEPSELMEPYAEVIDPYFERIGTPDWHQHVLSLYLVSGLFDGFFAALAEGLDDQYRDDVIAVLLEDTGRTEVRDLLASEIAADPALANRLALWGRRLVGDTLLVTRHVLSLSEGRAFVASEVEPVMTELIADHIRRMDGLGLTA